MTTLRHTGSDAPTSTRRSRSLARPKRMNEYEAAHHRINDTDPTWQGPHPAQQAACQPCSATSMRTPGRHRATRTRRWLPHLPCLAVPAVQSATTQATTAEKAA
jgi:hypothetical protein